MGESNGGSSVTRRQLLQASSVLGASALAGCGGVVGGFDDESLIIGYQPFYAEAWSALLIRHGELWEAHLPDEYDVADWEVALQGAVIGNKMIAEQNDIGYTGDMPTITAIANENTPIDVVAIAGFSEGQQCNLCFSPAEAGIEGPADLDDLPTGLTTGTCTHRFLLEMALEEGIEPDIQDQDMNTITTNVRQGNLTAGLGWEPAVARSVTQEAEAEYVFTGADYSANDAAGILMLDSLIEEHPEAAKGWLKAELEAKHIMATDEERTLDLIQEEGQLRDYERETLRASLYEDLDVSDVARMEFYTDFEAVEAADLLLKQEAPEFLFESQEAISQLPSEERYRADVLHEATEELDEEVEWEVRRGEES